MSHHSPYLTPDEVCGTVLPSVTREGDLCWVCAPKHWTKSDFTEFANSMVPIPGTWWRTKNVPSSIDSVAIFEPCPKHFGFVHVRLSPNRVAADGASVPNDRVAAGGASVPGDRVAADGASAAGSSSKAEWSIRYKFVNTLREAVDAVLSGADSIVFEEAIRAVECAAANARAGLAEHWRTKTAAAAPEPKTEEKRDESDSSVLFTDAFDLGFKLGRKLPAGVGVAFIPAANLKPAQEAMCLEHWRRKQQAFVDALATENGRATSEDAGAAS